MSSSVSSKRLKNYLDKQLGGMQSELDELSNKRDEEKLHKLRVRAKKVKAVSGFLKNCLGHNKKYSTREMKELYEKAGKVRTAHLNLATIDEHAIRNGLLEKDQKQVIEKEFGVIDHQNKKFKKSLNRLRRKLRENIHAIKARCAVDYYYSNIRILSDELRVIDEGRLHECRKIIKRLLYNQEILPITVLNKIQINVGYLKNLENLIGDWHDTLVSLQWLQQTGQAGVQDLVSLENQKQEQLHKIIQETREFDSNVMLANSTDYR